MKTHGVEVNHNEPPCSRKGCPNVAKLKHKDREFCWGHWKIEQQCSAAELEEPDPRRGVA